MKIKKIIFRLLGPFCLMVLSTFNQSLIAQIPTTQALPDTTKLAYNQISESMGVFVYPSKDQSHNKQKSDEFECYLWALDQTGVDPLNLPKLEVQQSTGPTGGAIVGSARGAAAGAAIGAIAGDAGKGAAIGATAGALQGRRQGQMAQAQHNQQAQAGAAAEEKAALDKFKNAFSVCMEGRGYTVK